MKKSLFINNYIVLRNFIPYTRAIELSNNFKEYCNEKSIHGDSQSPNSHSKYNYIPFVDVLCEKVNEISTIVEERVIPSYSYARIYLNKSVLKKHTDRDACEVSATVHLNGDATWPIYIKTLNNDVACVTLNIGDAMIYNGIIAEHWRDEFSGTCYTQLFLHYVRSCGSYSNNYFDMERNCNFRNDTYHDYHDEFIFVKNNSISDDISIDLIYFFEKNKDALARPGCTMSGPSESKITTDLKLSPEINKYDKYLFDELSSNINAYMSRLRDKYGGDVILMNNIRDTGYHIQVYKAGVGKYSYHQDSCYTLSGSTYQTRILTFIWYLNTVDEGGETEFFKGKIKIKPERGKLLIFPSTWTYLHQGNIPISNDKYIITGWVWVDIWDYKIIKKS